MAKHISETPFQLGFRAGRARQKRGTCPYPQKSAARKNWLKWYSIGLRVRHGCNVMNDSPHCKRPTDCVASSRGKHCRSCGGTFRMKRMRADPVMAEAARKRSSEQMKKFWDDPVLRAKFTAANKERAIKLFRTKEMRDAARIRLTNLKADPAFHAKNMAAVRAYLKRPEVIAEKRALIIKVNARPGKMKRVRRALVRNGTWLSDKQRIEVMEAVRDTDETLKSIGKRYNRAVTAISTIAISFGVYRGKKRGPRKKS